MVRHKQGELPLLSDDRKEQLQALAQNSDSQIDYSDIPALDQGVLDKINS